MALREELEKSGNWLFRHRSYLPLLLAGIIVGSVRESAYLRGDPGPGDSWALFCLLVSLAGLAIRIYTVGHVPSGTSGRTTRCPEAAVLNTTGIYSIVRHPLYVGNFFIWLGISMFPRVWWTPVLFAVIFYAYYEKIMLAEEAYLRERFGAEFEEWTKRTPAFVPRLGSWKPPALAFSPRNALRREYSGLMSIVASFVFIEVVGDLFGRRGLELEWTWGVLLAAAIVAYVTLRFLKRKTHLLSVPGR